MRASRRDARSLIANVGTPAGVNACSRLQQESRPSCDGRARNESGRLKRALSTLRRKARHRSSQRLAGPFRCAVAWLAPAHVSVVSKAGREPPARGLRNGGWPRARMGSVSAADERDRRVAQTGRIARQVAHVDAVASCVGGRVSHMMQPIIDVPWFRIRPTGCCGVPSSGETEVEA